VAVVIVGDSSKWMEGRQAGGVSAGVQGTARKLAPESTVMGNAMTLFKRVYFAVALASVLFLAVTLF
jgi:hypothetical protein